MDLWRQRRRNASLVSSRAALTAGCHSGVDIGVISVSRSVTAGIVFAGGAGDGGRQKGAN